MVVWQTVLKVGIFKIDRENQKKAWSIPRVWTHVFAPKNDFQKFFFVRMHLLHTVFHVQNSPNFRFCTVLRQTGLCGNIAARLRPKKQVDQNFFSCYQYFLVTEQFRSCFTVIAYVKSAFLTRTNMSKTVIFVTTTKYGHCDQLLRGT